MLVHGEVEFSTRPADNHSWLQQCRWSKFDLTVSGPSTAVGNVGLDCPESGTIRAARNLVAIRRTLSGFPRRPPFVPTFWDTVGQRPVARCLATS